MAFDKVRSVWDDRSRKAFECFPNFPRGGLPIFLTPLRHPLPPLKFTLQFKWKISQVTEYKTVPCASGPHGVYPKDPTEQTAAKAADRTAYAALLARARVADQAALAKLADWYKFGSC